MEKGSKVKLKLKVTPVMIKRKRKISQRKKINNSQQNLKD